MKVLNLYSGIGGNRKLWQNVEVTAVELNPDIAHVYKDLHPDDNVIVDDAHDYLLKNYKEYDLIWASPPCPTHSDIRRCGVHKGQYEALYPDMTLYQEIILLKHFAKGKWIVENVKPYYTPLIPANAEIHRHLFWSNFFIPSRKFKEERIHSDITGSSTVYGFNLTKYEIKDKRKILRNMVNPEVGKFILDLARDENPPMQEGLFEQNLSKNSA